MLDRKYLLILNIINGIVFIFILYIFSFLFFFDDVIVNPDGKLVFFEVFFYLKNVFIYTIYLCLFIVAVSIVYIIASAFSSIPDFNAKFLFDFVNEFFKNYLGLWFAFPDGKSPYLYEVPDLIVENFLKFLKNLYLFSFVICLIIGILYFIRAIFQNDPKYSLIAIGCIVLMIVIPLMAFGLKDMFELFHFKFKELNDLVDPLSSKFTNKPIENFFDFMASPVTLLAIMCYIYLEIAFQINYTDTVTKPSFERSERLRTQLRILKRESILITADVDVIKEEAKKRREEIEEKKEKVRSFLAKTTPRFSFVKEMIEKKKLEEEEKKLVSAASKTRRLGRYTERLFKEDSEAENTLTAKSSAPESKNLATSTLFNFSFRVGLLIIISFILLHPKWFFENVFNLPPAITESMAMFSPEVIIIMLVPLILLFPLISYCISYAKHRNLIIRLKQEGRIKEILASVGDYVKVEEEKEEDGGEAGTTETTATETA